MRFLLVSVLCLGIAPAMAQDMHSSFNKCAACHEIGEGAINKVGPQLNGVVGQLVGGQPGYSYSAAMLSARAEGVEWTPTTLTQYFKLPKHFMPGTSMTFAGFSSRADINDIIDYLASFDADGRRIAP